MSDATNVTADFIFGTLATDDLRLDALKRAARGVVHAHRLDPIDPEPGQPVTVTLSAGVEIDAAGALAVYTLDGGDPALDSPSIALAPGEVVWDTLAWGYRREWTGTLPAQPAGVLVRYRLAARLADGSLRWADPDPVTGRAASFAYHVDAERVPAWVRDAVIYHIFVDRFHPGAGRAWLPATDLSGFHGGTIRGVIDQLPYLEDLGVTCLWLSPVFPSPTHHGYDATSYDDVEPRLGTTADLLDLCHAAHDRGIKVLLDFVASHVSNDHPVFQRALANRSAPERAWFTIDDAGGYRSFFGVGSMPQVDVDHPAARDYLIDAATRWLGLGADGFRLDYANGPSHAFWSAFRAATRAVKPESFTAGEIVETAELQRSYQGRLDGVLDFLLLQHLRAFFAFETIDAARFDAFLQRHLAYFPSDFTLPSFLDNHDMNRFPWVVRGDVRRLKLAALCQFTLPHPPIIYYGTEVGLSQTRDLEYPDGSRRPEESRTLMPWGDDQDRDLLRFYGELIAVRRRSPERWRGARRTLHAEGGCLVVAIESAAGTAVVALNRSEQGHTLTIPVGVAPALHTNPANAIAGNELTLAPMSGTLLAGGAGQPRSR